MLYEAVHTHPAAQCPLKSAEGRGMLKQIFSAENSLKSGANVVAGYMSCPDDQSADHMGFFTAEAANAETVKKFFGAMTVEVRPVKTLAEVAKTL